jgi:hypothetical protein
LKTKDVEAEDGVELGNVVVVEELGPDPEAEAKMVFKRARPVPVPLGADTGAGTGAVDKEVEVVAVGDGVAAEAKRDSRVSFVDIVGRTVFDEDADFGEVEETALDKGVGVVAFASGVDDESRAKSLSSSVAATLLDARGVSEPSVRSATDNIRGFSFTLIFAI